MIQRLRGTEWFAQYFNGLWKAELIIKRRRHANMRHFPRPRVYFTADNEKTTAAHEERKIQSDQLKYVTYSAVCSLGSKSAQSKYECIANDQQYAAGTWIRPLKFTIGQSPWHFLSTTVATAVCFFLSIPLIFVANYLYVQISAMLQRSYAITTSPTNPPLVKSRNVQSQCSVTAYMPIPTIGHSSMKAPTKTQLIQKLSNDSSDSWCSNQQI